MDPRQPQPLRAAAQRVEYLNTSVRATSPTTGRPVGLAGLFEAARLAERLGAAEVGELWGAFDGLKAATADSIRWVLGQQRAEGQWETYVPSGPGADRGLYSTIIGAVAYFHPTRLYYGAKLGDDVDRAFRLTLDTIWSHFVQGGFRHDSSWQAYGPYLTLQLAHAFLLIGDVDRMDQLLGWAIGNAAYAHVSRYPGADQQWQVTTGTWNEQHAYPVSNDFTAMPFRDWYMGDMPHGWAAAEFMLLLREMLFFEAGEDDARELYVAPGIVPRWLRGDGEGSVTVTDAATTYGPRLRLHTDPRRAEPAHPHRHHPADPRRDLRASVPARAGRRSCR